MARFPWDAIAADSGLLVLRRKKERLVLVGETPAWYRRMFPEQKRTDGDVLDVLECFAFLASFLPDAEEHWDHGDRGEEGGSGAGRKGGGSLRSDPWVENERPLQARALVSGKEHVLVVECVTGSFERSAETLQQVRGQLLEHSLDASARARAAGAEAQHRALIQAVAGCGVALQVDGAGVVLACHPAGALGTSEAEVVRLTSEAAVTGKAKSIAVQGWTGYAAPTLGGDAWAVLFREDSGQP